MQAVFLLVFIIPASWTLCTRWRYIDYFSKSMIFIYMVDLSLKLGFSIWEYF
jgi:hypothetical protein